MNEYTEIIKVLAEKLRSGETPEEIRQEIKSEVYRLEECDVITPNSKPAVMDVLEDLFYVLWM